MNHLNTCLEYMIEQWKMLQQCCRVICKWANNQKCVFCLHQHNHSYRYPVLFPVCMRHGFSLSPSVVEHSEMEGENWQKPYCSSSYRKCVKCGSDIYEYLWSLQVQTKEKKKKNSLKWKWGRCVICKDTREICLFSHSAQCDIGESKPCSDTWWFIFILWKTMYCISWHKGSVISEPLVSNKQRNIL